jgi:DNA ligase-1
LKFAVIAESYEKLESNTGRLEMTAILALLLKETPRAELPMLVYLTQGKLRPDYEGIELGIAEKFALRALSLATAASPEHVRSLYIKFGDIGTAAQKLLEEGQRQASLAEGEELTLVRVYDKFMAIAKMTGGGSTDAKIRELISLINDATPREAKYILRTATGVLRLGVADYTILDACSVAFFGSKEQRKLIERAYNITSDLGYVVQLASGGDIKKITNLKVQLGKPIRPMLAERLESAKAILAQMGNKEVAVEYKLDGERLQIHKDGERVDLFSRKLERITDHYPDVVELAKRQVKVKRAILEGEVVAINTETGEYLPFQELMHRRRKYGIKEAIAQYPIAINAFDLLYVDGKDYTNETYDARRKTLEGVIQRNERVRPVPALRTSSVKPLEEFMELAISDGSEGVMVKDPASIYRAGSREFSWIKLKREYASELTDTIDLVIIGGFHGRGRRTGAYGAYLLAAYDKEKNNYPSISKIGTGFSDEDLKRFPALLKDSESEVRPANCESNLTPDVWFKPKLVIEVIASEITLSPIHRAGLDSIRQGSGLALRFPKFTGKIREDKRPEDATTVAELIEMYRLQLKKVGKDKK